MLPKKVTHRILAVAVVLAVVALTTGSLTHVHSTASSEANCQVCHVSHASAPGPSAPAVHVSIPVATLALIERVSADLAPLRAPSIPRAPPA
ncbi:MAG TPA: hypothetical protein VJS43_12365 [Candidatus Acidoferrales bacterium]|nr:hypothetical protein [Candidatus Acidoferrales bacterium]